MNNINYNPERSGLELVALIEEPNLSYSFNMLNVWADKDNNLYWAQDEGCSCPTPFERYYFVSAQEHNLNCLEEHSWEAFEEEADGMRADAIDLIEFKSSLRKALRDSKIEPPGA